MSCTQQVDNPFLQPYDTPFGVPPFHKIKVEHYEPAIMEGISQKMAEIQAIVSNTEAPTFDNVILPLDNSGELLNRVLLTLENVDAANTNDQIMELLKKLSPILSKHRDDINMNPALFAKVKEVYQNMDKMNYTPEQRYLVEKKYKHFMRGGANLNENEQEKLRALNKELAMLALKFSENLLAENNNFQIVIENEADLAGLPQSVRDMGAAEAKAKGLDGKWVYTVYKSSMLPFITYSQNAELRHKLYAGYFMRGNNNNANDNKKIVSKIVELRQQRAQILGYPTHAHLVLDVNMAKEPQAVYQLLMQVWKPAIKRAQEELADMCKLAENETGSNKINPADWWYYAEKVRKQKFDLDEEMLRPYLPLEGVRQGVFNLANKLYGLTFEQLHDMPVYHPDAQVFEVKEADGKHLGVLYLDFFPRQSKGVGGWCTTYREQSYNADGSKVTPVVSIVTNFTQPTADRPALLTYDEAETLFHEFGHALHALFQDVKYKGLADVPRDFVELPSQVMENWANHPIYLKQYAKHYQTGEPMPDELIDKMTAASHFNQGFMTTEFLAAALLDMDYHTLTAENAKINNIEQFEQQAMERIGLIPEILPRYRSTYFSHIFGSVTGYSSGYYSYTWSEVLDADAFEAFVESGDIFSKQVASNFRNKLLSKGGTKDAMELYVDFRGHKPGIEPLLKNRGLLD